uniref:Putative phosphoglycan beta 1,2 arabinosyltransferase n=1 Tax=Angomonas deanei TaxID=59799 RepID=C6K3N3_9TRYP|nr:putative phosphoglycan beta 1,2 arabinosyltransferase [Angomonas deanei]
MLETNSLVQHRNNAGVADTHQPPPAYPSSPTDRPYTATKQRGSLWWSVMRMAATLRRHARRRTRWVVLLATAALLGLLLALLLLSLLLHPMKLFKEQLYGLHSLQRALFFEDEVHINASASQPARAHSGVCALCADGTILFRAERNDADRVQGQREETMSVAHETVVCFESIEDRNRGPNRLGQAPPSPLHDAHDCIARLHNLGLLAPPRSTTVAVYNASCEKLQVSLRVLEDSRVALPTQFGAVVAQLQRSSTDSSVVELATPRLTVWPETHAFVGTSTAARNGSRATPLYIRTAAVAATDVDSDVARPSAFVVDEVQHQIVVKFASSPGGERKEKDMEADELHCPLHFLTLRLGRFGRHHNQLQEILNGVALATELNRTFILPPFVPALYTGYLKMDTEIFYGWNTLRQHGRYCVLTYAEARPLLRSVYAEGNHNQQQQQQQQPRRQGRSMSMERVHFVLDAEVQLQWDALTPAERELRTWGYLPRLPSTKENASIVEYDAEEWFACGVRKTRSGAALLTTGESSTALLFSEARGPTTLTAHDLLNFNNGTTWEKYYTGVQMIVARHGGHTRRRLDGNRSFLFNQPDLVVLSSATAFHVRPRLPVMTRLLGLLRPSPYITSEVGRYYRLWARQYKWPPYTNARRTFDDCLQPSRLRGVVGIHVRRRELTCRDEAEHASQTLIPLTQGRYVLEGTGRHDTFTGTAPVTTTVARLANDCVWNVRSVVHLFRQYAAWLTTERRRTAVGEAEHYTSYMAYDEQAGPIGQEMEVALQRSYQPRADELLADGMRPSFTAVYDRRSRVDFREVYDRAVERVTAPAVQDAANTTAVEAANAWKMDRLIELLYPIAELEVMGLTFDFFMLSNTEVFRGNAISSVSINVCLRRWGRGLPCHGVMVGYYESMYKGFL